MYRLPNELLLLIYKYSDIQTRLKLNKIFKWSYRAANPFMEQYILPLYPLHNKGVPKRITMFNYVMRGH